MTGFHQNNAYEKVNDLSPIRQVKAQRNTYRITKVSTTKFGLAKRSNVCCLTVFLVVFCFWHPAGEAEVHHFLPL